MAKMIEIKKPDVICEKTDETSAKVIIKPLENGFGVTIGNALRRTLLSTLPGAAAVAFKIDGVQNEFSTLPHVKEDIVDIALNIKSIKFKAITEDVNFKRSVRLFADEKGIVRAEKISLPADVEILNPEQEICTLEQGGSINMEIYVGVGRGYRQASDNKSDDDSIDVIHLDSLFTPVESASYQVSDCRVGQSLNYDELQLSIKTNGTESPMNVLATSAKILYDQLKVIIDTANSDLTENSFVFEDKQIVTKEEETPIEKLELTARATNCLRRANIKTLEEITAKTEVEMRNIKNLGEVSLNEIKEKLEEKGLGFRPETQD